MAETTIAYPLLSSKLYDQELELSILSMLKFYVGHLDILIVGQKPKFHLPTWARFVEAKNEPEALRDAIKKIEIINQHVKTEDWIYCHDDIFALAPFRLMDLETVLYTHLRRVKEWNTGDQKWAKAKLKSALMIGSRDVFDTATHMPRLFNKNRVEAALGFGNRMSNGELWDFQIVYDGLFTRHEQLVRTLKYEKFLRFQEPIPKEQLRELAKGKLFMNTGSAAFNQDVIDVVMEIVSKGDDKNIMPPTLFQREALQSQQSLTLYQKCIHRGENTGETGQCGTCFALTKTVPIFKCAVHEVATENTLKKPNSVYGRPMTCIQCLSDQLGFAKKPENAPNPKLLQIQSPQAVDQRS